MDLCSRLGRLLVQLAGEPVDAIEITYGGSVAYFDTRLLRPASWAASSPTAPASRLTSSTPK